MRTGNKLMTGIVGGIALLTMMVGGVQAEVWCYSGEVLEAGTPFPNVSTSHGAMLMCEQGQLTDTIDWGGNDARMFELTGTNKDIKLLIALAAIVGNKKVKYGLANAKPSSPLPSGNVNGHLTAIYLTNIPVN